MNQSALATCVVASLSLAALAGAADFDGSKTLLCAPGEAIDCAPGGRCVQSSPEQLDVPRFITVDFGAKRLSGKTADGVRHTSIQNVQSLDGKRILQGAEGGRGWSIVIDEQTGGMSAAVADQSAGFLVFGACTPK